MPTYEYECSNGHHFEVEQSIKDPALKRCRVCRAKAHRLISASHFILKGSGWYADGYGSSKPKASGADSGSESKGSESKAGKESKSESKSDAKPAKSGGEKSGGSSKSGAGSAASPSS